MRDPSQRQCFPLRNSSGPASASDVAFSFAPADSDRIIEVDLGRPRNIREVGVELALAPEATFADAIGRSVGCVRGILLVDRDHDDVHRVSGADEATFLSLFMFQVESCQFKRRCVRLMLLTSLPLSIGEWFHPITSAYLWHSYSRGREQTDAARASSPKIALDLIESFTLPTDNTTHSVTSCATFIDLPSRH